jgi:hypothetical protein
MNMDFPKLKINGGAHAQNNLIKKEILPYQIRTQANFLGLILGQMSV